MSNIDSKKYKTLHSKCNKGQIERDEYSYVKKKTQKKVSVPATCINDKGKPGKGPKLITIPNYDIGLLSNYGYILTENHERRVKSLKKAIKFNSELKILRHLNALRTLHKSNPKLYNKLDKDLKWIQKDYKKIGGEKSKDFLEYEPSLAKLEKLNLSSTMINEPGEKVKTFSPARLSEKSKDFLDNEPASFESKDSKTSMLLNNLSKTQFVYELEEWLEENDIDEFEMEEKEWYENNDEFLDETQKKKTQKKTQKK